MTTPASLTVLNVTVHIGLLAFLLLPARLWQLSRWPAARSLDPPLKVFPRLLTDLASGVTMLLVLFWLATAGMLFLCPPWRPHCDLSALMLLPLVGAGYGLFELLYLPVTMRRLRGARQGSLGLLRWPNRRRPDQ